MNGWKSKKDVTLHEEHVSWICGWGSNIMEWVHLFGFFGGVRTMFWIGMVVVM